MRSWHIVTGEYPPSPGGVSDYTYAVAGGLAAAGDAVHVWCPATAGGQESLPGVDVHALAGSWSQSDFGRMDVALDQMPGQKRLLVQWVPHAYGRRSLNLAFCRWIRRRARTGDTLDLMVHEPCLAFRQGSFRQDAAAVVHRVMVALLLSHARRVWVAIPAWADRLRPWAFGRDIQFCWLPVPSNVPVTESNGAVAQLRSRVLTRADGFIVGHFSTYSRGIRRDLGTLLPRLLADVPELQIQLLGRGGEQVVEDLRPVLGADVCRVHAPGALDPGALSCHLQACDLMMQPYPDGVSTRRGTLMAALAHGLPVVTTIGGLSESFWRDSDAVAGVPVGNLPALARMVSELARQPERRRCLASAARATYESQFSLPHVINALRADSCRAN